MIALPSSRPRVMPPFRLQYEEALHAHVLLYPEGLVRLNVSAGEIMRRCDGTRAVSAIVEELEALFRADGLEHEVIGFVELAGRRGWLAWERS